MGRFLDVGSPGIVRRAWRGIIAARVRGELLGFSGLIDRLRGSLSGAGRKQSQGSDAAEDPG